MIIDHITLLVQDFQRSKQFYTQVLATLGIGTAVEFDGVAGLGKNGKGELWLRGSDQPQMPLHIAFLADNRQQVDAFHAAALAAGAKDNGAPGVRDIYHPNYYGAFVIDLDGNNIEAVCHTPA